MRSAFRTTLVGSVFLLLSACALDPYVPSTTKQEATVYDSYVTTVSGCKIRYPSKYQSWFVRGEWSGACDQAGFAVGEGVFTAITQASGLSTIRSDETGSRSNGLSEGYVTGTSEYVIDGKNYRTVTAGRYHAGQPWDTFTNTTYINGQLESVYEVVHGNGEVTVRKIQGGTISPSSSDSSDGDGGVAFASTLLTTAIGAKALQSSGGAGNHAAGQLVAANAMRSAANSYSSNASTGSSSAESHSQQATQCVRQQGNSLVNSCNTTVSVVWCVEGDFSNCSRGMDNESNISAGGSITALPLAHPGVNLVTHFFACTGSNTATAHGWNAKCD